MRYAGDTDAARELQHGYAIRVGTLAASAATAAASAAVAAAAAAAASAAATATTTTAASAAGAAAASAASSAATAVAAHETGRRCDLDRNGREVFSTHNNHLLPVWISHPTTHKSHISVCWV
jgi:pyruvate/2-oxoglutarate dehydrogenase complex dihydrolipoamide acyltransferase (E2) component